MPFLGPDKFYVTVGGNEAVDIGGWFEGQGEDPEDVHNAGE
jgi:hypothetical protein